MLPKHTTRITRRMGWLVFNLRWTVLAAAAVLAIVNTEPGGPLALVITLVGLATVYNIGLTLLEFFEYQERWIPWVTVVVDSLIGLALFWATDDITGPLIWIGLLPAMTIALRRGWLAALITIALFNLAQAGLVYFIHPDNLASLIPLGLTAAALWPLAVGASEVAQRLRNFITAAIQKEKLAEMQVVDALRSHARAIYEMSSMVSAALDYNKVLDAALNFGAMGAGGSQETYSNMVSAVLTFQEDQLHVTSAWRLPPADEKVLCPAREGVLAEAIRTGDAKVILTPGQDPELKQFIAFGQCKAVMVFPLRVRFDTYGVVLYGNQRADFFNEDVRAFLTAVVNQAIIALQNAQLYHKLREEKERLVEVQEEAQKKLARDLHDGPTQNIAALAMRANFTRRLMERDVKQAAEELLKMEDLARKTTKEIRHMLFTLRPLVLESQGLTAALQQLAEKMRETHNQNVIVEAEAGIDERLEKNQQGVLFYLTEEAVGNARKHAQAQHVWVRLKTQRDVLILEIQDDGVGFNVGAVNTNYEKRGSLGMVNMRERAEILDGAVKIDSQEGKGTRISVLVPLTPAAVQQVRG
jgi:signal transduction histidine kinase